jgi:SH3-like domain-containing protein
VRNAPMQTSGVSVGVHVPNVSAFVKDTFRLIDRQTFVAVNVQMSVVVELQPCYDGKCRFDYSRAIGWFYCCRNGLLLYTLL